MFFHFFVLPLLPVYPLSLFLHFWSYWLVISNHWIIVYILFTYLIIIYLSSCLLFCLHPFPYHKLIIWNDMNVVVFLRKEISIYSTILMRLAMPDTLPLILLPFHLSSLPLVTWSCVVYQLWWNVVWLTVQPLPLLLQLLNDAILNLLLLTWWWHDAKQ